MKQLSTEELVEGGYRVKREDTHLMKDGKLDIETIEKHGTGGDGVSATYYYGFDLGGGQRLFVFGGHLSGYLKDISTWGSLYRRYYEYYPSGVLRKAGVTYRESVKLGTWYEYNEEGRVIDIIDYDRPFKFTLNDVLDFMKRNNIKDEDLEHLARAVVKKNGKDQAYWEFEIKLERYMKRIYTLDGVTGDVVEVYERDDSPWL
ncbi:MAG: hypothetical protein ACK5IQ_05535 [Bacteroidales bacterium]